MKCKFAILLNDRQYIQNLNNRKEEVVRIIDEQGKLTDELQHKHHKSRINCKK